MKQIYSKLIMLAVLMVAGVVEMSGQDYFLVWKGYASADGSGGVSKTGKTAFFASRNRSKDGNDGKMSTRFYTATFKADDFWRLGIRSLRYHVEDAAGNIVANSWSGHTDYALGSTAAARAKDDNDAIVIYETYGTHNDGNDFMLKLGTKAAPTEYTATVKTVRNQNTGEGTQNGNWKNKGMSYAFFFDNTADTDDNNNKLTINVNGSLPDDADKMFYIIGNLANANPGGDWSPFGVDATGTPVGRIRMARIIYPIGETDESKADSIVYSATVKRPANGWGDLYIGVAPHSLMKDNAFSVYEWQHIIRPQVEPNLAKRNGVFAAGEDATARYGTLYCGGTTQPFDMVSLNPVIDPSYTSYTFSMNITTATYRITFHTGLYIIGDAINGWDKGQGVLMPYNDAIGGWEKDVTFTGKGCFRFAQDESMFDCYGENGTAPLEPDTDGEAVADEDGDLETQFVNKVMWFNEGTDLHAGIGQPVSVRDGKTYGDIRFLLEPGTYTVRFYASPVTSKDNEVTQDKYNIYYTIDRKFGFYAPSQLAGALRDADGRPYKSYRSFSNYHRMSNPATNGIDVYIVTAADGRKAAVKKVEGMHIPANTGVLLASRLAERNTEVPINVCAQDPWAAPVGTEGNLMQAAVVGKMLPMKDTDGTYTMRFGYAKLNADDTLPTLGFFPQKGDQKMNANSAYFRYRPAAGAKAMGMAFEMEGMATPTGIGAVEHADGVAGNGLCYTILGTVVSKPVQKGIYIRNGKKVIIK